MRPLPLALMLCLAVSPFVQAANPIISHKFTADPAALVHEGTVYLYAGHDEDSPGGWEGYVLNEWLCFSSQDMVTWKEEGVVLRATDFTWASGDAWASQVIERDGKFYFYSTVELSDGSGKGIGVAVADRPQGPFVDATGVPLITNGMTTDVNSSWDDIDPSVFIDDDGQAYLFWGNTSCKWVKLNNNMTEIEGDIHYVDTLPFFTEAPWIHKKGDWYYLSYAYGWEERIAYAMSDSIEGPWKFKEVINTWVENCNTNHQSIIEFKGRDYFIYHNGALPNGGSFRRSVCVDYLYYNEDGTIKPIVQTDRSVDPVGDGLYLKINTVEGSAYVELDYEGSPLGVSLLVGLIEGSIPWWEDGQRVEGESSFYSNLNLNTDVEDGLLRLARADTGIGNGGVGYSIPEERSDDLFGDDEALLVMIGDHPNKLSGQLGILRESDSMLNAPHSVLGRFVNSSNLLDRLSDMAAGESPAIDSLQILRYGEVGTSYDPLETNIPLIVESKTWIDADMGGDPRLMTSAAASSSVELEISSDLHEWEAQLFSPDTTESGLPLSEIMDTPYESRFFRSKEVAGVASVDRSGSELAIGWTEAAEVFTASLQFTSEKTANWSGTQGGESEQVAYRWMELGDSRSQVGLDFNGESMLLYLDWRDEQAGELLVSKSGSSSDSLGTFSTMVDDFVAPAFRGNPIVTDMFTADPTPLVHDDTLYIYTGHDIQNETVRTFRMEDWYAFSTTDMHNYEKHGPLLSIDDFSWANADAYASHCTERNGKFYWYVSLRHRTIRSNEGMSIGVAVSDSPTGPFVDAIGEALITDDTPNSIALNIDPAVYVDDDGQAYLYWGSWNECRMVKLKENMIELDGEVVTVNAANFFEAPFIHKRGETYYLTYASGYPSSTEYSTSYDIEGPWTYRGVINDLMPVSETNHQGVVEFKGDWYFIYHSSQAPGGGVYRRSVCVDKLVYDEDGLIKKVVRTDHGVPRLSW